MTGAVDDEGVLAAGRPMLEAVEALAVGHAVDVTVLGAGDGEGRNGEVVP